jgi:hypothetical protein
MNGDQRKDAEKIENTIEILSDSSSVVFVPSSGADGL